MSYSPLFRGNSSKAASTLNATGYQNATGSSAPIGAPVSTSGSGQFALTDVSSEPSVEGWLGLASEVIPNTATGLISSDGRIQNVNGWGFSNGDAVWVGSTPGTLTNVKPDLGSPGWSSGDFVLFVGVVVQNEFNPSVQDIQLCRQIVGQL